MVEGVFIKLKENKEPFRLIRKAHLEYLYLDYLNEQFTKTFDNDYPDKNSYLPYLYSGMLFNVSMKWLDNNCKVPVNTLAQMVVDAIYFE